MRAADCGACGCHCVGGRLAICHGRSHGGIAQGRSRSARQAGQTSGLAESLTGGAVGQQRRCNRLCSSTTICGGRSFLSGWFARFGRKKTASWRRSSPFGSGYSAPARRSAVSARQCASSHSTNSAGASSRCTRPKGRWTSFRALPN